MTKVKIYIRETCPFCVKALELIKKFKNLELETISIQGRDDIRAQMIEETGEATVPQIFINDTYIPAGCSGLYSLYDAGKLDEYL